MNEGATLNHHSPPSLSSYSSGLIGEPSVLCFQEDVLLGATDVWFILGPFHILVLSLIDIGANFTLSKPTLTVELNLKEIYG